MKGKFAWLNKLKTLTDEQLIELDSAGLIPGPSEDEQTFLSRVKSCFRFCEELPEELTKPNPAFPFSPADEIPEDHLQEGLKLVEDLHQIRPDWVPAFYSGKGLLPWQGGGAWIIELKGYRHPVTLFQLRSAFRKHPQYLGLYQRNELLAHEYSHVGRMAFQEHGFEEILSYQSSPSRFRRYWGPLADSGREILAFFAILLFSLFAPLFSDPFAWLGHPIIMALPFLVVAVALRRLSYRWKRFRRCMAQIGKLVSQPAAVCYRLTDTEIRLFGGLEPEDIAAYAKAQSDSSLRWRAIYLRFF